ncbi:MAG: outer membrane protein assembly factor BamC [Candidatus Azotimanducaceae bacterium]|jgi:outer membrane protein assembly factor BamC
MRFISIVLLVCLTASCGWFGGAAPEEESYIDTKPLPPLQIPDDLDGSIVDNPILLPVIGEQRNPSFYPQRPPLPDALYASDNRDEVRLQALGGRNWLVVPEPATTAWPKMKQFFADNGIVLEMDRPEVGRLNTAWLTVEDKDYRDVVRTLLRNNRRGEEAVPAQDGVEGTAQNQGKDRFLIRVEQGLQPQSTEVHIRHENDTQDQLAADDVISLNDLKSNMATAERSLLNEIGGYIAARVAETTVSKVALQIGASAKTDLSRNADGVPVLKLFLDRSRAWATLGQAMKNAEIEVNEQSSDAGEYDVTIATELFSGDAKGSVLCRVTFSCNSEARRINAVIQMSGDAESGFDVIVVQDGVPMTDADKAQKILVLIREFAT